MKFTLAPTERAESCALSAETDDGRLEAELDAAQVDALIGQLAEMRASMRPVHPARFDAENAVVHEGDNLLWDTFPDVPRKAVVAAFQSPGIGWLTVTLSRAQVEDLVTSLEFSAQSLRATLAQNAGDPPDGAETVPLRRAQS